jgi:hypothetical protein
MFLVRVMQMIDLCDEKLNLRRSINELKVSLALRVPCDCGRKLKKKYTFLCCR